MAMIRQRDPARLFLKRLGLLMLFIVVALMASGVWGVYKKERESRVLRVQAENERTELLDRETRLKSDIAKINTDRGVEEALRAQYALAGSGEELIIIVEPPAPELTPATSTSAIRRWFEKIFPWW